MWTETRSLPTLVCMHDYLRMGGVDMDMSAKNGPPTTTPLYSIFLHSAANAAIMRYMGMGGDRYLPFEPTPFQPTAWLTVVQTLYSIIVK